MLARVGGRAAPGERPRARLGLEQREGEALAGEGVEVARGVADQQHATRHHPVHALVHRARPPVAGGGYGAPEALPEGREGSEQFVEAAAPPTEEQRHPDLVGTHGRDVGLATPPPVHLDPVAPGRDPEVPAHAVPADGTRAGGDPRPRADAGVQAVGAHHVIGAQRAARGGDAAVSEAGGPHAHAQVDPLAPRELDQGGVQRSPPHPPRGLPVGKEPLEGDPAVQVADTAQAGVRHLDAQRAQGTDAGRHQALPARLVDRWATRLEHDGSSAAPGQVHRRGEPGRPPADHDHVRALAHRGSGQWPRIASQTAAATRACPCHVRAPSGVSVEGPPSGPSFTGSRW